MVVLQCIHHDSFDCSKSSASDSNRSRQSDSTVEASNRSPEGTVSSWESTQEFGNELSCGGKRRELFVRRRNIDYTHAHI
jgi:hypothetical protein